MSAEQIKEAGQLTLQRIQRVERRIWNGVFLTVSAALISVMALALLFIMDSVQYNSIIASRRSALDLKADAEIVAKDYGRLEGLLASKANAADIADIRGTLGERTNRNEEDLREFRAELRDLRAYASAAYKGMADRSNDKEQ